MVRLITIILLLALVNTTSYAQQIILNEILVSPGIGLDGDANLDGHSDAAQDQFVELVNISGYGVDLSGFQLLVDQQLVHTFAQGSYLAEMDGLVIFGGSVNELLVSEVNAHLASSGSLNLPTNGGTVALFNGQSEIFETDYTDQSGQNSSLNRASDFGAETAFEIHSGIEAANNSAFSPGLLTSGAAFSPVNSLPHDLSLTQAVIAENNSPGAFIGLLTVADADELADHEFVISNPTFSGAFTVVSDSLFAAVSFNHETISVWRIPVEIHDVNDLVIDTIEVLVTDVDDIPTVAFSQEIICSDVVAAVFDQSDYKNGTPNFRQWSLDGVQIGSSDTLETIISAGHHTLTLTIASSFKDTVFSSKDVFVPAPLNLSLDKQAICENSLDTVRAVVDTEFEIAYAWAATGHPMNTSSFLAFTSEQAGALAIELTLSGDSVCTSIHLDTIDIQTLPQVVASGDTTICQGGVALISAQGADSYIWSPTPPLNDAFIPNPAVLFANDSAIYTVTGTNITGCSATDSVKVNVSRPPELSLNGVTSACTGDEVEIHGTGLYDSLTWVVHNHTGVSLPIVFSIDSSATITAEVSNMCGTASTNHVISLAVTDSIAVHQTVSTVCEGGALTMVASGAEEYVWSENQLIKDLGDTAIYLAHNGEIQVEYIDASGCAGNHVQSVNVQQSYTIDFKDSTLTESSCKGELRRISVNSGAPFFRWVTSDTSITSLRKYVDLALFGSDSITVHAISANGCETAVTGYIPVDTTCQTIDNIFELGGDIISIAGRKISFRSAAGQKQLHLFDLSGRLVWQSFTNHEHIVVPTEYHGLYFIQFKTGGQLWTQKLYLQ